MCVNYDVWCARIVVGTVVVIAVPLPAITRFIYYIFCLFFYFFKPSYSPFLHEAPGASSRRLLKHTAHTAAPSVSNCASGRCVFNMHLYSPFLHEAPGASSRRLLKHTAHAAAPSVSKCASESCVANLCPYSPFLHIHTVHFSTNH